MAIDVRGFNSGDVDYSGLYKVSDDLRRNREFDERKAERELRDKERMDAKRASMASFLTQFADPKDHLSGSPTDPQVTKGFADILNLGTKLISENKGLTTDMLMTALAPQVGKLSEYATKAKVISQQIKDRLAGLPENSGYDKFKLQEAAKKNAFMNPDGSMKDVSEVTPETDYVAKAVNDNPYDVTNNKGLDEWLKGQSKMVGSLDVTHINAAGGKQRKKVEATAYPFAVPETDEGGVNNRTFVPAYEHAIDNGEKVYHDFPDGKGGTVNAPVRLLDKQIYKQILANSPGTADWVRGQVQKAIDSGEYKDVNGKKIDMNDPQADHIAQAILYDELKSRGMGSMKDVEVQKANPIDKFYMHWDYKNEHPVAEGTPTIDIYKSIGKKLEAHADRYITSEKTGKRIEGAVQANILDDDEQTVVLEKAKKAAGNDITVADIYVKKFPDGYWIIGSHNDTPITKLTAVGSNVPANQALGVKSKQKATIDAQNKPVEHKKTTHKGLPVF